MLWMYINHHLKLVHNKADSLPCCNSSISPLWNVLQQTWKKKKSSVRTKFYEKGNRCSTWQDNPVPMCLSAISVGSVLASKNWHPIHVFFCLKNQSHNVKEIWYSSTKELISQSHYDFSWYVWERSTLDQNYSYTFSATNTIFTTLKSLCYWFSPIRIK